MIPLVLYELELDDGGFVESGDIEQWQWGAVHNGPGSGFDGANAWSTGLAADYLNDAVDYLEIPIPDLTGAARPALRFMHWYDIDAGDTGWIEVDDGSGWRVAAPFYGYPGGSGFTGSSGGWGPTVLDLSGEGTSPRVRLGFSSDVSGVADGWTLDAVGVWDGDVTPPQVSDLDELADTEDVEGPYVVGVTAIDDVGVADVTLWWAVEGGQETALAMTSDGADLWRAGIPAQEPDTRVRYRVEASDGVNTAVLPAQGSYAFRVYLPAPAGLVGPEGRVVGTRAHLSWTPPETTHAVLGYEVWRGTTATLEVIGTEADVPLRGAFDVFSVRARFDAGLGDPSDTVSVDAVVPEVGALSPAEAWAGDTIRVVLHGSYLLLDAGTVEVDLGEGVVVVGVEVRDVDTAMLSLRVDADAEAGIRDLRLSTPFYELEEAAAFAVLPAEDRPRLTSVEPDHVLQGAEGVLTLRVVGELAATPTASLGEGIVVQTVEVDGQTVTVEYGCAPDASIGSHTVELDDGVRVFSGVSIEVRDVTVAPARTCGLPISTGAVGVLIAANLVRRRRRTPTAPVVGNSDGARPWP